MASCLRSRLTLILLTTLFTLFGLSNFYFVGLAETKEINLQLEKRVSGFFFSAPSENITQVRVMIFALDGARVFDSNWVAGNSLTWPMLAPSGQRVPNGVYLYTMVMRERSGREYRKLGKLSVLSQDTTHLRLPRVGAIAKVVPSAIAAGVRWQLFLGRGEDNFRVQRRGARDQGFETIFLMRPDGTLQVSSLCLGASEDDEGDCRDGWPTESPIEGDTLKISTVCLGADEENEGDCRSEWPALLLEDGKLKVSEVCLGASEQSEGDCRDAWPTFPLEEGQLKVSEICLGATEQSEGDCRDEWPVIPIEDNKLKINIVCLGVTEQNEGDCRSEWPEEFEGDGWTLETTIVSLANSEHRVSIGTAEPCGEAKLHVQETASDFACPNPTAVYGESDEGHGLTGASNNSAGVFGISNDGIGVEGHSSANYGLSGRSDSNTGVVGYSTSGIYIFEGFNLGAGGGRRFALERTTGNLFIKGSYYCPGACSLKSGSADVAEHINSGEKLEPGDVVEIDPTQPRHYRLSRTPSSTRVAGIISTQPGVVLGGNFDADKNQWQDERPLLALAGTVPVKVTTENGPILPGDLLVSASTPGYAMKAKPILINGIEIYPTGAILGKALESLESGTGVISVLVMLK